MSFKQILLPSLFPLVFFHFSMAQNRTNLELTEGWKFKKGPVEDAYKVSFDDTKWETVSVPHDWAIYGPFDKEIDKQIVAISQNGEEIATEKRQVETRKEVKSV